MKVDRRRAPLVLFLLAALVSAEGGLSQGNALVRRAAEPENDGRSGPLGTEHAPVDGRDGMPHEGPWIETETDRKNQKLKDAGEEEAVYSGDESKASKDMPQTNDGVMDDPNREVPEDDTRGHGGGVSQRTKDGKFTGKQPEQPKEALPMPYSEKERMDQANHDTKDESNDDDPADEVKKQQNFEVSTIETVESTVANDIQAPADLPDRPHDIPHPENPSSPKDNTIIDGPADSSRDSAASPDRPGHEPAVISPMHSLFLSFMMILVSEIGDKTFLVAALMAMRHDRMVVFSAAYGALVAMTVLSALLGHAVPSLISPHVTNFLAAGLFLVFGVRLYLEARGISPDEGVSEEMKEVEMELEEKEHQAARRARRRSSISPYALEAGHAPRKHRSSGGPGRLPSPPSSPSSVGSRDVSPSRVSSLRSAIDGFTNLFSLLLSPAWVQTFVMTFLGEWGDRSQIATIAMAAGQDYWWVTAGALGGHAICTGVAVLGGKAIAGRVSLRTVTMGGAIAFFVFGILYLLEALY